MRIVDLISCMSRLFGLEGGLQEFGILLEAIIGDSYSITFGDGLVTVKSQPVTSQKSLNDKNN